LLCGDFLTGAGLIRHEQRVCHVCCCFIAQADILENQVHRNPRLGLSILISEISLRFNVGDFSEQPLAIKWFSTILTGEGRRSGKSLSIIDLSGERRRQLIDTQQVYEVWREANQEANRRFGGSMRWVDRNGTEYLLRKTGRSETSLGPRGAETEAAYQAFTKGRKENKSRLQGLSARLDQLAPVNRAMGLGRVPNVAARILRVCDEHSLLGEQLIVVGTNALFAYEVLAGVQVQSDLLATGDIDLLYDARRHISLAVKGDLPASGLIGLLRKADVSFDPLRSRAFRASNRDGYLVDLIRPEAKDVFHDNLPASLTDHLDDLEGAAIFGLGWLVNSPRSEAVAIDERGYPVRMVVVDPRAFALHKAWLSSREDRELLKAKRDLEQAKAAAAIAAQYLRLPFDSKDLEALPGSLRKLAPQLSPTAQEVPERSGKPNW
jgi:hypothetical protein